MAAKIRIPGIGRSGLGEEVRVEDACLFKHVARELIAKFRGYYAGFYEAKQVGILENLKYADGDLRVYAWSSGLNTWIYEDKSFEWFKVRKLKRILMKGPSWGAACFGAVGLFIRLWDEGERRYGLQLSGRMNSSLVRFTGASKIE